MDKQKRDLQVFGYGLAVIAALFGIGGALKHGFALAPAVLMTCSVIFAAVTALDYKALEPGYRGWMKVAYMIGTTVTMVILGAVFFLVFTPVGLFLKLLGKDHLDRKFGPAAKSYWIKRAEAVFRKERYRQQF